MSSFEHPRSVKRTHVPEMEQWAENQRPKTPDYPQTKLYRYEDSDIYQWWSKRLISIRRDVSPFEEPFSEPFVIAVRGAAKP